MWRMRILQLALGLLFFAGLGGIGLILEQLDLIALLELFALVWPVIFIIFALNVQNRFSLRWRLTEQEDRFAKGYQVEHDLIEPLVRRGYSRDWITVLHKALIDCYQRIIYRTTNYRTLSWSDLFCLE